VNPLKRAYQVVVPHRLRAALAEGRYRLTHASARREAAARMWVAARRPVRPVRTPFGVVFADVRDRGVGLPLYRDRHWELAETRALQAVLRPGMTYLDVGANIGYFVALAASAVGPGGRVVAVEPDPYNFGLLSRTVRFNRWNHVTLLNMAAGPEKGTARLFKSGANLGDHRLYADGESNGRAAVEVPVGPLDAEFAARQLPPPDVVKIDIQGFEELAFRGMGALLAGDRPMTVLSEFWPLGITNAGGDPAAYLERFRAAGFACFHPEEDGRVEPVAWDAVGNLIPPVDPTRPDWAMTNLVFRRGAVPA